MLGVKFARMGDSYNDQEERVSIASGFAIGACAFGRTQDYVSPSTLQYSRQERLVVGVQDSEALYTESGQRRKLCRATKSGYGNPFEVRQHRTPLA